MIQAVLNVKHLRHCLAIAASAQTMRWRPRLCDRLTLLTSVQAEVVWAIRNIVRFNVRIYLDRVLVARIPRTTRSRKSNGVDDDAQSPLEHRRSAGIPAGILGDPARAGNIMPEQQRSPGVFPGMR